jgi:hypothetical protein
MLREVQVLAGNARRILAGRPEDRRLGRLVGELTETIVATERLLAQTDQHLDGNRVIPDRLVSLADPDAQPIREGKPRSPTHSATRCWWPKTSVASSATTGSSGATLRTRRRWSQRSDT